MRGDPFSLSCATPPCITGRGNRSNDGKKKRAINRDRDRFRPAQLAGLVKGALLHDRLGRDFNPLLQNQFF
jgi:hypothetical protein